MANDFRESLKTNTNSDIFLLPSLGFRKLDLKKYGFISTFIDDTDHDPHYPYSLYLLFNPEDQEAFNLFVAEEGERRGVVILEEYDYDGGYVVLVYKFPEQYKEEFNKFLGGKYASFRNVYKKLFPETNLQTNSFGPVSVKKRTIQFLVFNKDPDMKKFWEIEMGEEIPDGMDYWPIPNKKKETLDIALIRGDISIEQLTI